MIAHRSASLQLFLVLRTSLWSLGVIFYDRWVLSEGHKNYFKEWISHESEPTFLFLCNLFKLSELWPYYQKHVNQIILNHITLKLSFTNIWGFYSNFVDCKTFLELNCSDILALCETNLDDSIDSGNFSVRGYLPLIQKDSSTHMHGLQVYLKEGQELSLVNPADSYLRFRLALLYSVSYFFFPLSITFFVF